MITIEIYTHTDSETDDVILERHDISIHEITEGDNIIESDFGALWDAVLLIDTSKMPKYEWVRLGFQRAFEPKEYEAKNMYFEFVGFQ